MTSGIRGLGLLEPEERPEAPPPGQKNAARPAFPPFRRSRAAPPAATGNRPDTARSPSPRLFLGLSRGGTLDDLTGFSPRRRAVGAGVSAGFHLLLLLLFLGALVPVAPSEPAPAEPAEDPLLYAFEAPPLEEPDPVEPPVEPLPAPPPEGAPPDAAPLPPPRTAGLVIPKAQIEAPSTGFQNDLPFSQGQDEEFYTDVEMGDDPAAEAETREATTESEPELLAEAADPATLGAESPASPGFEGREPLQFDAAAFRRLINDPTAEVRRRSEELAMREARRQAERERRRQGEPTDIWRFLEGKRFRNPEGGLVSNRNNTLYYDDRGANLVPWISRLIAEVRRNWYIPYAATYDHGHVAIAISVLRSGELAWLQVVVPSGVPGFDNAAVGALRGAQLLPLPDDYPGADFEIMLVFWYNEQPYDLFSAQG